MRRCCLCGAPCVPMADYTAPVCIRCDAAHESALLRLYCQPAGDGCPVCEQLPCRCRARTWAAAESPKPRTRKASRAA